jgi:uncharacterized membrane protein (UPF0127 family)
VSAGFAGAVEGDARMIRNRTSGETIARDVVCCVTFWKRGRGLIFRRPMPAGCVYLFVESQESVGGTAIHMFFVFFPIAVVWLDHDGRGVDRVLARPFRPYYASRRPARYAFEGRPSLLERVDLDDQLELRAQAAARY